mgnify:FL=1
MVEEEVCEWIYYDGFNSPCFANEPVMFLPEFCEGCGKRVVGDMEIGSDGEFKGVI